MKNGSGRRAPAAAAEPTPDKVIRCAIYTRKSTEEGLQQDFSSLDAQREAGEAFIASQRNEGWQLVPERFDDGGFTGGNMDRPALKRLLAAIEAGRVNCVVVYKVDRLSRSLMDFARMMELFDRCGALFVLSRTILRFFPQAIGRRRLFAICRRFQENLLPFLRAASISSSNVWKKIKAEPALLWSTRAAQSGAMDVGRIHRLALAPRQRERVGGPSLLLLKSLPPALPVPL